MGRSKIEWLQRPGTLPEVWNVTVGCSHAGGPGCENCYAERMAKRQVAMGFWRHEHIIDNNDDTWIAYSNAIDPDTGRWSGEITCRHDKLDVPLHWKKPRRVFVCSMSDLFHDGVPASFIQRVWDVMAVAFWHTFLVLTKRPDRACDVLGSQRFHDRGYVKPLANVHVGVSVEHPDYLWRIDELRRTPAAVRFVSLEPLLGLVGIGNYLSYGEPIVHPDQIDGEGRLRTIPLLDWVIVGGESGPEARPCNLNWIRNIIAECKAANVSVFVKQLGTHWARKQSYLHYRGYRFNYKGANMEEWPADLRVREYPDEQERA